MADYPAHNAYLNTQVKTASKEQLLLLLFDGALKFAHQTKVAIEARNIEAISTNSIKVQSIVSELMSSLDDDLISEELYKNLINLYAFVHKRMVSANLQRKTSFVDEAIQIIERLRGIWSEAVEQSLEENGGSLESLRQQVEQSRQAQEPLPFEKPSAQEEVSQPKPPQPAAAQTKPKPVEAKTEPAAGAQGNKPFKRPKINLSRSS